jgi:hypothetical protein
MATENDWFTTNIHHRLIDKRAVFVSNMSVDQSEYRTMSFEEASAEVVKKISNKYENIYVPLSGGMDSEYVFNCFYKAQVKFTPVIVNSPANQEEVTFAFKRCEETRTDPVIIEMKEHELLQTYYELIYKKLGGKGFNSVAAYVATKYIKEKNGISIIGEHGYDGVNEWDFYNDILLGKESSIYFFLYTPEIHFAMVNAYEGQEDHQEFKHNLYKIPKRHKMTYTYSHIGTQLINRLMRTL